MATTELKVEEQMEREAYAGVLRFYELAKKQEWQVRNLPWGEIAPCGDEPAFHNYTYPLVVLTQ